MMRCNHSWLTPAENFFHCVLTCCTPTGTFTFSSTKHKTVFACNSSNMQNADLKSAGTESKASGKPWARQTQLWANGWAWITKPFWAAATYFMFISTMQSPNSALAKAAGTKEWARAPSCHAHEAGEQQGLGTERISWKLPLLEHK